MAMAKRQQEAHDMTHTFLALPVAAYPAPPPHSAQPPNRNESLERLQNLSKAQPLRDEVEIASGLALRGLGHRT